jgi:hypothetical protein
VGFVPKAPITREVREATRIMREIQGGPTKVMRATGEILGVDDDVPIWDLVVKVLTREGYFVRALPRGRGVL